MSILTDISSGAVGGLLGGIGKLAGDIRQAITGDLPPEKQAEIEMKLQELEAQSMNAQVQINLVEAQSESGFRANWRPFVGWVCGGGFAYATIFKPVAEFIAKVCFGYAGSFPTIETGILTTMLSALLGVGIMRSFDKKQSPNVSGRE